MVKIIITIGSKTFISEVEPVMIKNIIEFEEEIYNRDKIFNEIISITSKSIKKDKKEEEREKIEQPSKIS